MTYVFSAVFCECTRKGEVFVEVPALKGCVTSGFGIQDAIAQIKDACALFVLSKEKQGEPVSQDIEYKGCLPSTKIQIDTAQYENYLKTIYKDSPTKSKVA